MQAEDLITALDGESVQGKTLDQAVEIMRGELGTDITLTVYRPATQKSFDVTVTRATSRSSRCGPSSTTVISAISASTASSVHRESLEKELAKLDEEAAEADVELIGYILDLRNNPGGNLSQSIRLLMPSSTTVKSSRSATGTAKTTHPTSPRRVTSSTASRWWC